MTFEDFTQHFVSISVCMAHVPRDCWRSCTFPGSAAEPQTLPPAKSARAGELSAMWPDVALATGLSAAVPTAGSVVRMKSYFGPPEAPLPPTPLRAAHWFTLKVDAPPGAPSTERVCCMVGLHQVDERTAGAPSYLDVGLAVVDVPVVGNAGFGGFDVGVDERAFGQAGRFTYQAEHAHRRGGDLLQVLVQRVHGLRA